uniref:Ovule protein n=1 Tax=Steinernema glaseri TaxID=37863 RepID=A0A1I7YSW3_9BILA
MSSDSGNVLHFLRSEPTSVKMFADIRRNPKGIEICFSYSILLTTGSTTRHIFANLSVLLSSISMKLKVGKKVRSNDIARGPATIYKQCPTTITGI